MKRLDYIAIAPQAMEILMTMEGYFKARFDTGESLSMASWELVKLRVSQINQCAFCIDMHSREAQAMGESQARLLGLSAWRDMACYTQQERIALGWAEHQLGDAPISDAEYRVALEGLGEQALVDLTLAVNAINSWNRVCRAFKPEF